MVVGVAIAGAGFWLSRSVPEADRVVAEPDKHVSQRLEANPSRRGNAYQSAPPQQAPSQGAPSPPVNPNIARPVKDGPPPARVGEKFSRREAEREKRQTKRSAVDYEALRDEMLAGH
jgi:hypothetical protein